MLTLAEQIESALVDAENGRDRLIGDRQTLSERIEYYRGSIDAIRLVQKHVADHALPDEAI